MKYKINNYIEFIKESNFFDFKKYIFIAYYITTSIVIIIAFITFCKTFPIYNIWFIIEHFILMIGIFSLISSIACWAMNKIFKNCKFIYNQNKIIKIENLPIMLNVLIKIDIKNNNINSITQVSEIVDEKIHISIHYRFHPQEITSGYLTYQRVRKDVSHMSLSKGYQLHNYIPEYVDISVYHYGQRKYAKHLQYYEELYFSNPDHKEIEKIEDFIQDCINSTLEITKTLIN